MQHLHRTGYLLLGRKSVFFFRSKKNNVFLAERKRMLSTPCHRKKTNVVRSTCKEPGLGKVQIQMEGGRDSGMVTRAADRSHVALPLCRWVGKLGEWMAREKDVSASVQGGVRRMARNEVHFNSRRSEEDGQRGGALWCFGLQEGLTFSRKIMWPFAFAYMQPNDYGIGGGGRHGRDCPWGTILGSHQHLPLSISSAVGTAWAPRN